MQHLWWTLWRMAGATSCRLLVDSVLLYKGEGRKQGIGLATALCILNLFTKSDLSVIVLMRLEERHWCSSGSFLTGFSASVFYSWFWFLVVKIQMWQRQWWASTACILDHSCSGLIWSNPSISNLLTLLKIAPSADSFGNVSWAKEYPQICGPEPSASAIPNLVSSPDFLYSVFFCLKHSRDSDEC